MPIEEELSKLQRQAFTEPVDNSGCHYHLEVGFLFFLFYFLDGFFSRFYFIYYLDWDFFLFFFVLLDNSGCHYHLEVGF